jgi:anti-sigma-K factor RskA
VQWGGTACEKKDISTEFWLFASFGIAMTALVAGTVALLYNMGSDELPSVIGAGVAGPRTTK